MAETSQDKPVKLTDLISGATSRIENELYDRAARKAGYDPTTAYILGALTTDQNDLEKPLLNADHMATMQPKAPGMVSSSQAQNSPNTLSELSIGAQRLQLIQDLIVHYGKRYGKPQKTGGNELAAKISKMT